LSNLRWAPQWSNRKDSNRNAIHPDTAIKIRDALVRGDRMADIAKTNSVPLSSVSAINTGEAWRSTTGAVVGERLKKTRKAKVHLTPKQWAAAMDMLEAGFSMAGVAEQFGVTRSAVHIHRSKHFKSA